LFDRVWLLVAFDLVKRGVRAGWYLVSLVLRGAVQVRMFNEHTKLDPVRQLVVYRVSPVAYFGEPGAPLARPQSRRRT
jgi:hypothetical protein